MSTNRQLSFLATLEIRERQLNILTILYEKPIIVTELRASGGFFIGAPQKRNDSHLVGSRPQKNEKAVPPLTIYFRHTSGQYELYIHSSGPFESKRLKLNSNGLLGAFPSTDNKETMFTIIDEQEKAVTLANLQHPTHFIQLKTRNKEKLGGLKLRGSPYSYVAETSGDSIVFKLNILERNVPFPDNPNEA